MRNTDIYIKFRINLLTSIGMFIITVVFIIFGIFIE